MPPGGPPRASGDYPFPLAHWILSHAGARHDLAQSGMKGVLATAEAALRTPGEGDALDLQTAIARIHGASPGNVFLTHGATEGNALVLLFLVRSISRSRGRMPRVWLPSPEYPPLRDMALWAGARPARARRSHDLAVLSNPNNPRGVCLSSGEANELLSRGAPVLVDETFREFTAHPTLAGRGHRDLWVTGTFTKVYGADSIRVGFVVAPPGGEASFGHLHGLLLDNLPRASVQGALALLRERSRILRESRGLFRRNERILHHHLGGFPRLSAPVAFDRGLSGLPGDDLAHQAAARGVLVCPGSFFGDGTGVRLCLTRRTFARDLEAYLKVRDAVLAGKRPRP
jgi:histidinol-phosphate/aromatic aminotransferase/cobyric acid decarboxylase-like protein